MLTFSHPMCRVYYIVRPQIVAGNVQGAPWFQNLIKLAKKCLLGDPLDAYNIHGGVCLHWNQPR